ncbi:ankyrin [Auriculariales sp. MPI-PUGE-AT-0066]|nr:ankyrin [Auriculariales sp. MPI-PUGE-AT-0066]
MSSQPTPEASAFVERAALGIPDALKPALEHEAVLRKAFAGERAALPKSPYAGLVDVFADGTAHLRHAVAREIKVDADRDAQHVLPVPDDLRRKTGDLAMAESIEEFRKVFSVFSEGTLGQLGAGPWPNVVVAGGSVLAALLPLPSTVKEQGSKRALRKYFHEDASWASSDVDLFLWGLTPDQAEKRCVEIYEAIRDSVPWDVTCVRTKHAITLHSQYPYRNVQIVLRLYSSPAEILAGFDVDCACLAFDGSRLWASPRALAALIRQCNTIDITRRSPSYEVRLTKYARRGFEVQVPDLRRDSIDPTIFERSLARIAGLARLLVLEKISSSDERMAFLEKRRNLRGIPVRSSVYTRRLKKYKGDIKTDKSGLEISSYESVVLHLPYGPKYDAARIEKIVYGNDLGLNSPFNPKNKKRADLHRHPAFFGTMAECIEDCCAECPQPVDDDAKALQADEDEVYIRGRIRFIEDDPGRQSVGSFRPLDAESWGVQAYLSPLEKLFRAVVAKDQKMVDKLLEDKPDLNARDHVGRTVLHVAILSQAPAPIVVSLVNAGARITARLADGRTPLMLVADLGAVDLAQLLLDRSKKNAADEEEKQKAKEKGATAKLQAAVKNSADDMDTDDDEDGAKVDEKDEEDWDTVDHSASEPEEIKKEEAIPPVDEDALLDEELLPDIIDLAVVDWHYHFNALMHSIAAGALGVFETLLEAGASATEAVKVESSREVYYPLSTTLLTQDRHIATKMARKLISAGAVSSAGDSDNIPIFHRAVAARNVEIVHTLLRFDPKAKSVLNIPVGAHPLVTAIATNDLTMVVLLLAYGAKTVLTREDYDNGVAARKQSAYYYGSDDDNRWRGETLMPVEASLSNRNELYKLLIPLGAEVSIGLQDAFYSRWSDEKRANLIDFVHEAIRCLEPSPKNTSEEATHVSQKKGTFKALYFDIMTKLRAQPPVTESAEEAECKKEEERKKGVLLSYLKVARTILEENGAKTWNETHDKETQRPEPKQRDYSGYRGGYAAPDAFAYKRYDRASVAEYQTPRYDELFEAAWTGDDAKIIELCLPSHASMDEKRPLEIAVALAQIPDQWWLSAGINPFTAACLGRRWQTARLVLTIASAQLQKKDDEPDVEDKSCDSDDSDDDSEGDSGCVERVPKPLNLEDIAHRVSKVHSTTPPSTLVSATWDVLKGESPATVSISILSKAIEENDLELFVQVMNMLPNDDEAEKYSKNQLWKILESDSPQILEEYIRQTGDGIHIDDSDATVKHDNEDKDTSKGKRQYAGLTFHGVKRKDLASKNDPDSPGQSASNDMPLLWSAASKGAVKIMQWLSTTSGPVAAYTFFITSHGTTERARLLRRINLATQIPALLGFGLNNFQESALLAAISGSQKDPILVKTLKEVLRLLPGLNDSLNLAEERNRFTPLLMLVEYGDCPEAFDYLHAVKAVNLEAVDNRGYNILHICVNLARQKLFDKIMMLPADKLRALACRTSRHRLNTPLMIAIKRGYGKYAERLIKASPESLNLADVDGFLPLHVAVKSGYFEITGVVLNAGSNSITGVENGVGEIPLEVVKRQELKDRQSQLKRSSGSSSASGSGSPDVDPAPVLATSAEIEDASTLLSKLQQEDILSPSSKVVIQLASHLRACQDRAGQPPEAPADKPAALADKITQEVQIHGIQLLSPTDASTRKLVPEIKIMQVDYAATIHLLCEAPASTRKLAPLSLIQDSVADSLTSAKKDVKSRQYRRRDWHAFEDGKNRGFQLLKTDFLEDV